MTLSTLTFGCRLNAAESVAMQARAVEAGLSDAILVNTCAVTQEAVRQARQAIRRARREHPQKRIIVTGCAAQTEPETFANMPEVDLVLGNREKLSAESYRALQWLVPPTSLATGEGDHAKHGGGGGSKGGARHSPPPPLSAVPLPRFAGEEPCSQTSNGPGRLSLASSEKIIVSDIFSVHETASHRLDGFAERARAFVQVQNGCDHRCTFCIIPYGRGNSRSVPTGAIVDEIRRLVARGFNEIVLTGVDITAWGTDLPGRPRLGALIRAILKHVPKLPRLRLSSIDSVEADDELFRLVAEDERLMPHLHLSLQSGDDMILKRMRRRHSRADAIRLCDRMRKLRPDVVFGADLIAGFPTETDALFQNTLKLVDECGLTFLHVFPYSPRNGTPAARMPQLDGGTISARARTLRQKGDVILSAFLSREIGKTRSILVERNDLGHTEHYAPVMLLDPAEHGTIISAKIESFDGKRLSARAFRKAA